MAGVVASKVRKQRAIALSLKDNKDGDEDAKRRQKEVCCNSYILFSVKQTSAQVFTYFWILMLVTQFVFLFLGVKALIFSVSLVG
jgi:hypothetical protein